jgi:hypothetical protein
MTCGANETRPAHPAPIQASPVHIIPKKGESTGEHATAADLGTLWRMTERVGRRPGRRLLACRDAPLLI